jgi:hypothetical protein
MKQWAAEHRKAIVGGILAAGVAAISVLTAGGNWQAAVGAAVAAALGGGTAVNFTRNAPARKA